MGRGGGTAPASAPVPAVGAPTAAGGVPVDREPVAPARGAGRRRPPRWSRTVVLCAVVAAYLVAAYQPFRLEPPWVVNTIEVTATGGLRFDGTAFARTDGPPAWVGPAVAGGRFTVVVEARTGDDDQRGPARLLTLSADPGRGNLTLGQEEDDLYVRLRRDGSTGVGAPPIVVDGVFADDRWRTLVLRVGDGAATVEVDGAVVAEAALGDDPLRSWDGTFPLVLGSEVGGMHPWVGEIRRATVEAGRSTVDHLDPGGYELPPGRLAKPLTNLIVKRSDVVLNVLGFVAFGALLPLLRPGRRTVVLAAVGSLALSAVMEVGQLVVVSRDPSVLDLALNTLGGALGGVLVALAMALAGGRSSAR